ncbi:MULTISPECIES: hypothetical protein [Clostridium]|uniref:Uncharacterized protein n=1 Tax=Clostridium ragsdalei P11 TaxID=1353534 RepID=A0A1A6AMH7_9CLOT|nr:MULTISPECIES: hypothetical protein [Clostridium]OBR91265.1 hypothetical protein CLRAG_32070 [Clostridium ragsdalei P11]QXE17571.1 hypothetical protein B5S50_01185 [Clostridium sp. 001]
MIRRLKNKLFATLCITTLTLGVVAAPSAFNSVKADAAPTKTVYVDVEKNVLGEAPILQPVKVTLSDTNTIADATKQAVGDGNVNIVSSKYGSYVTGFKDTTDNQSAFTNNYLTDFKTELKTVTKGIVFRTNIPNQPIVTDANYLSEKECDGISGWMFTVNNVDHANSTYYDGSTTLANVPDGAAIRWEFSAAAGCDLGLAGYLPDGTLNQQYGTYNWNTTATPAFFSGRADKTNLIAKMANHVNKTDTAYTNALTQLETLQATQDAVNAAASAL